YCAIYRRSCHLPPTCSVYLSAAPPVAPLCSRFKGRAALVRRRSSVVLWRGHARPADRRAVEARHWPVRHPATHRKSVTGLKPLPLTSLRACLKNLRESLVNQRFSLPFTIRPGKTPEQDLCKGAVMTEQRVTVEITDGVGDVR